MFCSKFGWHSMKVLQIEVRRLTLFGCSLKTLADVQCTSTRKRGQLPISPIWRRRSTNVKKSTAFCTSLRFALRSTVCILPLVRSLRFTLSNGFSIVCLAPLFSCISLFFFSALPYFYSTMSVLLSSLLCASLTHSSTVIYNVYFAFFPIWSVGLLPWRKKFRFRYTCDVRLGRLGMPHRAFICNKRRNPL